MCFPQNDLSESEYILGCFEERFCRFKGRRILLCPGRHMQEIMQQFDDRFLFLRVTESEGIAIPSDTEMVIVTDWKRMTGPEYERIRSYCEDHAIPLFDPLGIDLISTQRELDEEGYLTIAQWKDLLSDYDAVSLSIPWTVADHDRIQNRWVLRHRFLILYRWLIEHGKDVFFLWSKEEEIIPLSEAGIPTDGRLIKKRCGDVWGYSRIAQECRGRKTIHIGVDLVTDGIIPREYGLHSRRIRYFSFKNSVSTSGREKDSFRADKDLLKKEIDRHDVISFDIFDTLLKRTVLYPKDVFEMMEERTGLRGFAERRYEIQTTCFHYSFDEIYERLKQVCGYDERLIETLMAMELELESEIILPRESMVEMYRYAREHQKIIVLVSDMYLSPSYIEGLLAENGITGYMEIFISCRFGKLKHEGLFEELVPYRKDGASILHIGDNYFSDIVSAKSSGLDSFYVPSALDLAIGNGYEAIVKRCGSLTDRMILGLGIALGFDDPFREDTDALIANMIIAPLVMGYLIWVKEEMTKNSFDLFLLSSRDGKILQNGYESLRRRTNGMPPGKYFYMNRHAAFLTIMDDYERAKRFVNFSKYDQDPPGMLLNQFCIPKDHLLPFHGEPAAEYCRMHEKQIHESAEHFRSCYRKYLKLSGISGKKCAVMDFVSAGSSQSMLERHVSDRMEGYYVGAPEYISTSARNIHYYFDHDLFDYDTEMKIEVYFTSMEPALDHIDEHGRPVFAEETRSNRTMERISDLHRRVDRFIDFYLDHLYYRNGHPDREMLFELCRTINLYDTDEFFFDDFSGREIAKKTMI